MHIVVTGGTGSIGMSLLEVLGKEPSVRSITAIARRVPDLQVHKTFFVGADVAEEPLAPLFEGADAVVHLAWRFQPKKRPDEMWSTNVLGSRRVFDAVRQAGVPRLIYASSFAAYAPRQSNLPVAECYPTTGVTESLYSRNKADVERRLDEFEARNPGIGIVRLRPCLTLGGGAGSELLRRFAASLLPGAALGSAVRQIARRLASANLQVVHAREVADALRLVLVRDDVRGAFNVAPRAASASGADATPCRAVMRAAKVAFHLGLHHVDPNLLELATRAPLLDDTRAQRVFGFAANYTTEQVLAEALCGFHGAAEEQTPDSLFGRFAAQNSNSAQVSAQYRVG